MIKRFPSRNSRSKGIKVKHVLQICLLLGVCFWLIYQVKHSHDKKKEFDEKDAKVAVNGQGVNENLKLGRKDLQPLVDDVAKNDKVGEDEDDETVAEEEVINGGENKHAEEVVQEHEVTKHEEEEREDISKQEDEDMEEDETKHEEEEQEEEKKADETEEEVRGAGVDEIDEHDHDKLEVENIEEDAIDEEKEKGDEENKKEGEVDKNDGKEAQVGHETLLKDADHDDGSQDTYDHEAREEHYRADDASSAVTHDAQTTESDKEVSENTNGKTNTTDVQEDEIANNSRTENLNAGQTILTSQLDQGEVAANSSSDATVGQLKDEKISLPSSENKSTDNTTSTAVPDDDQQKSDESAVANPETVKNSTEDNSSLAAVVLDSTSVQNATTGDSSAETTEPQKVNEESISGKDQTISTPVISEAGDKESSNSTSDSESGVHNQNVEDEATGEEQVQSGFSNTDNAENKNRANPEITHDPIDSSDSSVDQEENPGLGTDDNEKVAAE